MRFWRRAEFPLMVFTTGAAVLVVEVLATRILAPHFGNTLYVISSVLGIILGALSAGYYAGGLAAERRPSSRLFYTIIFFAGLSLFVLEMLRAWVLPSLAGSFTDDAAPITASLVLFTLPSFLFGLLSPFAVKLQSGRFPERGVGETTGEIFFFSTLGSIAGSFLAGFYLVPSFGVSGIILGLGSALAAGGLAGAGILGKNVPRAAGIVLGAALLCYAASQADAGKKPAYLFEGEGVYEHLTVFDGYYNGREARFLRQNTNWSSGMFPGSGELAFEYSRYLYLADLFTDVRQAAVVGAGAFSIPKAILESYPESEVDVVDIEPTLFDIAQEYFELAPSPRLHNHVGDGRRFLALSGRQYDLIFADVYYAPISVPAHFATKEFFELVRSKLAPNGVFLLNFVGSLDESRPSLLGSEMKTLLSVFPNSYFFAMDGERSDRAQNFIFLSVNGEERADFRKEETLRRIDPRVGPVSGRLLEVTDAMLEGEMTFTDDYAPVEALTRRVIHKL